MTPIDLAKNLAQSERIEDRALGVGIIARGLSDDDPATLRQGWPLDVSVERAIVYLGLEPTAELTAAALAAAPKVSDAMLNRTKTQLAPFGARWGLNAVGVLAEEGNN